MWLQVAPKGSNRRSEKYPAARVEMNGTRPHPGLAVARHSELHGMKPRSPDAAFRGTMQLSLYQHYVKMKVDCVVP